jgi:hypothetical protein
VQAMRKGCGVPVSLQLLGWLESNLDRRQINRIDELQKELMS